MLFTLILIDTPGFDSHLFAFNSLFGSDIGVSATDSTFTASKQLIPFYNKPGDLLITRQDCTHGDFPAMVPHKKSALVLNYF